MHGLATAAMVTPITMMHAWFSLQLCTEKVIPNPLIPSHTGNYWMYGWLIKQTPETLELVMSRVRSCNDVIY